MIQDPAQPSVLVRSLSKQFSNRAVLRELDFQAFPTEFVVLLGANGAGKTTFLRILATLARPTRGEVTLVGQRLPEKAAAVRGLVGLVSHQPQLYGELSASENLHFFGQLYGLPELARSVDEMLQLVGLYSQRSARVRTFSRGMQQRLSIGRAMLHDPLVLLLDEPYSGLDPAACDVLDGILRQVTARHRTVLMATHDLAHAAGLGTRFDVLQSGHIAASSSAVRLSPAELKNFYQDSLAS